jgi:F-type H+-transporting ATPase subunit b
VSVFRLVVSMLTVGAAIFALAIFRAEVPGIAMTLFASPEFYVLVGFVAVIVLFLWLKVPGMVAKMLDARAAAISKELDEAKRLREEAAALLAGYVRRGTQVEAEAGRILTEAKAEAERFAKETRASLREQIARRAEMAQEKIAQAETAAIAEIRALAADTAAAAAEKLIARRIDEKRASALIGDSIKDINEKLN